eukprot:COSAG01_NODE_204_length_22090_cov_64.189441_7_plen_65_part_00
MPCVSVKNGTGRAGRIKIDPRTERAAARYSETVAQEIGGLGVHEVVPCNAPSSNPARKQSKRAR